MDSKYSKGKANTLIGYQVGFGMDNKLIMTGPMGSGIEVEQHKNKYPCKFGTGCTQKTWSVYEGIKVGYVCKEGKHHAKHWHIGWKKQWYVNNFGLIEFINFSFE